MDMAQEERAQIVKYLRETQALHQMADDRPLVRRHHADSCKWAADAIMRGEHWKIAN
jgi:hypothetical protein